MPRRDYIGQSTTSRDVYAEQHAASNMGHRWGAAVAGYYTEQAGNFAQTDHPHNLNLLSLSHLGLGPAGGPLKKIRRQLRPLTVVLF